MCFNKIEKDWGRLWPNTTHVKIGEWPREPLAYRGSNNYSFVGPLYGRPLSGVRTCYSQTYSLRCIINTISRLCSTVAMIKQHRDPNGTSTRWKWACCSSYGPFLSNFLPPLSFSDVSPHSLSYGLPRFLKPSCFFVSDLFGNLSSFILTMCPAQHRSYIIICLSVIGFFRKVT